MTTEELIAAVRATLTQYETEQAPPAPLPAPVPTIAPADFVAALADASLPIFQLQPGVTYAGSFAIARPVTIQGNGATLRSTAARCLDVQASDVTLVDVICYADDYLDSAIRVGKNDDTQTFAAQVPTNVTLDRVRVPTFRGKRGIEWHAEGVLRDCEVLDTFYPAAYGGGGTDSQGLWIHNTTGNTQVIRGRYQGGAECMMVGGDTFRLTDSDGPVNLLFEDVLFDRPAEWQGATDYQRGIKNTCELKNGRDVTFRRCTLRNCWKASQDGYAFMFTPTRGGRVRNVLVEDCTVENHASAFNVVGSDSWGLNAMRNTLHVVRGSFKVNKALYGGVGRFLMATAGPSSQGSLQVESIIVENAAIELDGTAVVLVDGIAGSSTTAVGPQKIDLLRVTGSSFDAGQYGFSIDGNQNATNWTAGVTALDVTGNTIRGAVTVLRTNLPTNTHL